MSILYATSIVYIAGEYCDPGFCTPIIGIPAAYQLTILIWLENCAARTPVQICMGVNIQYQRFTKINRKA